MAEPTTNDELPQDKPASTKNPSDSDTLDRNPGLVDEVFAAITAGDFDKALDLAGSTPALASFAVMAQTLKAQFIEEKSKAPEVLTAAAERTLAAQGGMDAKEHIDKANAIDGTSSQNPAQQGQSGVDEAEARTAATERYKEAAVDAAIAAKGGEMNVTPFDVEAAAHSAVVKSASLTPEQMETRTLSLEGRAAEGAFLPRDDGSAPAFSELLKNMDFTTKLAVVDYGSGDRGFSPLANNSTTPGNSQGAPEAVRESTVRG